MAIFGFIGTGSMGGALARAARRVLPGDQIFLSNRTAKKAEDLAAELGCRALINETVAEQADFIFLGVKPQMLNELMADIAPTLQHRRSRFVLVSMAAGVSIDEVNQLANASNRIIRIMPNMPAAAGEGMTLYSVGSGVSPIEVNTFLKGMSAAGRFARVPENLINAGSAVSGCGPAFVDLFAEALADGGVACGLPRPLALELAAQTLLGSARLLQKSGLHPGMLKDAVCSPGGTTIQGVRVLEQRGFRAAAMDAVIAAYEKTLELQK